MKTETFIDPSERITSIKYTPENYDAFPLPATAWMDGRMIELNRDREAAAHALLLLPFISGRLHPARGCGVDVAGSLSNLFLPRKVIIDGVTLSPARIPVGTRATVLCDGSYRSAAIIKSRKPDLVFRLSESAYATAISPRNAIICSNFNLFARTTGQLDGIIPTIAASLLLAEDLGIARLVLPIHSLTDDEAELLAHVVTLLSAVNISVETPLLDADVSTVFELLGDFSGLEMFLADRHEHVRDPIDLPDLWIARFLTGRSTGDTDAVAQAASRLRALLESGHRFSPAEQRLLRTCEADANERMLEPSSCIEIKP